MSRRRVIIPKNLTPCGPKKPRRGACPPKPGESLNTPAAIVRHYLRNRAEGGEDELDDFASHPTLTKVVEHAGLAKFSSGKRAPHQYRIPRATLAKALKKLKQCDFSSCKSFHELFEEVEAAVGGVRGIGELYIYDTALRIGAALKLEPEYVYLHAGARSGAKALGFRKCDYLEVEELPAAFRKLRPRQIEDCLCIYKDVLRNHRNHW